MLWMPCVIYLLKYSNTPSPLDIFITLRVAGSYNSLPLGEELVITTCTCISNNVELYTQVSLVFPPGVTACLPPTGGRHALTPGGKSELSLKLFIQLVQWACNVDGLSMSLPGISFILMCWHEKLLLEASCFVKLKRSHLKIAKFEAWIQAMLLLMPNIFN